MFLIVICVGNLDYHSKISFMQ